MQFLWRISRRWYKARYRLASRYERIREEVFYRRARLRATFERWFSKRGIVTFVRHTSSMAGSHLRRQLIRTMLVIIGIVAIGIVSTFFALHARERLVARLSEKEGKAVAKGDNAEAVAALRWLVRLEPNDQASSLRLAQALAREGEHQESHEILDRLAPSDGRGYAPAYLVRAKHDVGADDVSAERLQRIQYELEHLNGVHGEELDELQLQLWLRTGQIARADALLNRSEGISPTARLLGARTYASLGMRDSAMRQATLARLVLEERIESRETMTDRLLLAEAYGICGRFEKIEQILRVGLVLYPNGPFAEELCRLHAQISQQPGIDAKDRMQLIASALDLLLRSDKPSGQQHALLYQLHLARGDANRASKHLAEATAADPAYRMELARFMAPRNGRDNAIALVNSVKADCIAQLRHSQWRRGARLLLAEAQVFLADYEGATASLAEGYEKIADPAYALALHRTYLAWWDAKTRDLSWHSDDDLEALEKAAMYCPRSLELVKRLHEARRLVPPDHQVAYERLQSIARHIAGIATSSKL